MSMKIRVVISTLALVAALMGLGFWMAKELGQRGARTDTLAAVQTPPASYLSGPGATADVAATE